MRKLTLSRCSVTAVLVFAGALSACSEEQTPAAQNVQATPSPATTIASTVSAVPVKTTAAVVEVEEEVEIAQVAPQTTYSPESLETLLAPIALYPDPILAQVLAGSTNPQEVLDAGNWLVANPDLKGKELQTAGTTLGLTPPMLALIQFPTVVDMMCMEMDWTTELGTAFQADQSGVLDAVQRLRKQAAEVGNLKTSEQMKVTTEEENDQQVIVVQPANPQIVYVPQYNPTTVYTTPPTAATSTTTTVVEDDDDYSGGQLVATGLLAFGAGILANEVFDDDDHDYYSPNWGYGGGGYYPPPYYPRYGNGYRPANGYNRPTNYQHGFNNNNIYVNADGKDYFNRFEGGRNNYRKQPGSPISTARNNRPELGELNQRAPVAKRPAATAGQTGNRKVQGSYAGAKPGAVRPGAAVQRPAATSKLPKGTYAGAASPAARQKLNPQTAGARDRGHTAAKPAVRQQHTAGNLSKPAAKRAPPSRSSAFQGSRKSGNAERAASNRGRASMSQGGRSPGRGNSGGQKRGSRR